MSFITLPLSVIKIFIVVKAVALPFSQVLLPLAMILVISPLLLVCTVENANTVPYVSSVDENMALVMISITVCVLAHDSVRMLLLIVS